LHRIARRFRKDLAYTLLKVGETAAGPAISFAAAYASSDPRATIKWRSNTRSSVTKPRQEVAARRIFDR